MASRKGAPARESQEPKDVKPSKAPKAARKTEKLNVWLNPDQVAWLKEKGGPSETVRALITEAMALDQLRLSVMKKKSRKQKAESRK